MAIGDGREENAWFQATIGKRLSICEEVDKEMSEEDYRK